VCPVEHASGHKIEHMTISNLGQVRVVADKRWQAKEDERQRCGATGYVSS
jgi:hypothetical protein